MCKTIFFFAICYEKPTLYRKIIMIFMVCVGIVAIETTQYECFDWSIQDFYKASAHQHIFFYVAESKTIVF